MRTAPSHIDCDYGRVAAVTSRPCGCTGVDKVVVMTVNDPVVVNAWKKSLAIDSQVERRPTVVP